jgi:hypothetical protein
MYPSSVKRCQQDTLSSLFMTIVPHEMQSGCQITLRRKSVNLNNIKYNINKYSTTGLTDPGPDMGAVTKCWRAVRCLLYFHHTHVVLLGIASSSWSIEHIPRKVQVDD